MRVESVLHTLWTNCESKLEKEDEKRLWILLQTFILRKGPHDIAANYDTKGGRKRLEDIKPSKNGLLSRLKRRLLPL